MKTMNRRGFLRFLVGAAATVTAGPAVAEALLTRKAVSPAVANAVAAPLSRSLDYQAIGRKLLLVDELPQGALARYEKDVASVAHVLSRRA